MYYHLIHILLYAEPYLQDPSNSLQVSVPDLIVPLLSVRTGTIPCNANRQYSYFSSSRLCPILLTTSPFLR